MTTWSQVKCPECGGYNMVIKENKYEPFKCSSCNQIVQLEAPKTAAFGIVSGRINANSKISSEFRDCVLNPIMSVRGAANANRKFG
jgi:domain of unknown function (DUF329)